MPQYTYHGPVQHISIAVSQRKNAAGDPESVFEDVALVPGGDPVELPSDNSVVEGMIHRKLLLPVKTTSSKSTAKPAKKGDT